MKNNSFDYYIWDNQKNIKIIPLLDRDERYEIKLWSGLYDKNGEKIFEGDILKYHGIAFSLRFNGLAFRVKQKSKRLSIEQKLKFNLFIADFNILLTQIKEPTTLNYVEKVECNGK